MPGVGGQDLALEAFGGYVTSMAPSDLPHGASPLAQDVVYPEAGVRQRPGLSPFLSFLLQTQKFNGLENYIDPQFNKRLLAFDDAGKFYAEVAPNVLIALSLQGTTNLGTAGNYMRGESAFGRKYLTFFDGNGGVDLSRQWDGTNYDRLSMDGPGAGPDITDFLPNAGAIANPAAAAAVAISAAPAGAVRGTNVTTTIRWSGSAASGSFTYTQSTVVTIQTNAPHGLVVGDQVQIAGVTDNLFNGIFFVDTVPDATHFTYKQVGSANATSGSGTSTKVAPAVSRSHNVITVNLTAPSEFRAGWTVIVAGVNDVQIGGAASAASKSGVVTVTTTTPHNLVVGATAIIKTAADATYNGSFKVQTVVSPTVFTYAAVTSTATDAALTVFTGFNGTYVIASVAADFKSFTVNSVGPDAQQTNAGGTATVVGNIAGGQRQVSVCWITRQGFISKPSPPVNFNASGGKLVSLSKIPLGPSNVTQRLLIFSAPLLPPVPLLGQFYSQAPAMVVANNVDTTAIIDFADAALLTPSNSVQTLFSQVTLGECASILAYDNRLSCLGERTSVPNFVNLSFDGGWNLGGGVGGSDVPLGWTSDPTFGAGGSRAQDQSKVFLDGYRLTGDQTRTTGAMITQTAYQDYLGVPIIDVNTKYSVRFRAWGTSSQTSAIVVELFSASSGGVQVSASITGDNLQGNQANEFSFPLVVNPFTKVPTDLILRVSMQGPLNQQGGNVIVIKNLELFPTLVPINASTARISFASNQEAFHQTTGIISVRPNNGWRLRGQFKLRKNLYFGKDFSLDTVVADANVEPAFWEVLPVSDTIGICGPNAVDTTEEWAVFAHRSGVYIFTGADPIKISQAIHTDVTGSGKVTWDSINWNAQHTIWVRIDTANRLILVGVPTGAATSPNKVFMMDYKFLESGHSIASAEGPSYSSFTGKLLLHGQARRWAYWNISANSCVFAERGDGLAHTLLGNGTGTGKIYDLLDSQKSDDGVAINARYQTYGQPQHHEEQPLQLTAHRKLCDYLTGRIVGSGSCTIKAITPYRTLTLRDLTLGLTPLGDFERKTDIHGERIFWEISTNGVGAWFQLEKFIPSLKPDPCIPVRGSGS